MKFFLAFLLTTFSLLTTNALAQGKKPTTEQVQFKTSAVCDMCKARLEKALAYEKGVQAATLDVSSKVLTVSYRPDKTTPDALRAAVQQTGYDADNLPADARAYGRLPECCKKDNTTHTDKKM